MPRKALAGTASEPRIHDQSHRYSQRPPEGAPSLRTRTAPPRRRIVFAPEGWKGEGGQHGVLRATLSGKARTREAVPRCRRFVRPRRAQRRRGVNTTQTVAAVPNVVHRLTCYLL
jgi:hypothetical protein